MLAKQEVVDQITILEDGQLQVRVATRILEDGQELSASFHRHVLAPGDSLDAETPRVAAIARFVHTPDTIAEYRRRRL